MVRRVLCRLGFHKWGPQHDAHGERFLGCVRCHKRTDPPEYWPPGLG